MNDAFPPSILLIAALLTGVGFYLIVRARFLVPALMRRSGFLRRRLRLARALVVFLLTVGILSAGMGCRILLNWLRQ